MVEQKWDIHHGHSLRSCLSATRPCVNGTEKDLLLVIRLAEAKRQRREKVNESSTPSYGDFFLFPTLPGCPCNEY